MKEYKYIVTYGKYGNSHLQDDEQLCENILHHDVCDASIGAETGGLSNFSDPNMWSSKTLAYYSMSQTDRL